jgi:hypothetical protein
MHRKRSKKETIKEGRLDERRNGTQRKNGEVSDIKTYFSYLWDLSVLVSHFSIYFPAYQQQACKSTEAWSAGLSL